MEFGKATIIPLPRVRQLFPKSKVAFAFSAIYLLSEVRGRGRALIDSSSPNCTRQEHGVR
jgi:hypothetical protein